MNIHDLLGRLVQNQLDVQPGDNSPPGIMGQMMGPTPPTPAPPPPQSPGVLASMFGGTPADLAQYGPAAIEAAKKLAMLHAGVAMMAAARQRPNGPGFGGAVQAGLDAGTQGYQAATQQDRAQQLMQARKQLMGQLQPQPGETPQDIYKRLTAIYPQVLALGDPELEKSVGTYLWHIGNKINSQNSKFQAVQGGDEIYTFDPSTGKYTPGPQRGIPQAKLDEDAQNRALARARIQEATANAEASRAQRDEALGTRQDQGFNTRNSKLINTGETLQESADALNAAGSSPEATKSALSRFTYAADANPRMMYSMIMYMSTVRPDLVGQFQDFISRKGAGVYSPETIAGMKQVISGYLAQNKGRYKVLYDEHRRLNPHAGANVATPDALFGADPASTPRPALDAWKPGAP